MGRGNSSDVLAPRLRNIPFKDAVLLFPADYANPRKCDPHFQAEFTAARDLGWQVQIFNDQGLYQAIPQVSVDLKATDTQPLWYRGWMLSTEAYQALNAAVGSRLLIDPDDYARGHHLPQWYPSFKDHTPYSVWAEDGNSDPAQLLEQMPAGAAIVKDYVKSMKHLWDEACFIPNVAATENALKVINRFRELRAEDLRGLVLREYHELGTQYRSWWVDGQCKLITAHPDTPEQVPDDIDLSFLSDSVAASGSRALSVDVAQSQDQYLVVEVGDLAVSDRPEGVEAKDFYQALFL